MPDVDISVLITEGAHLNNKQFDGNRRTRTDAWASATIVKQISSHKIFLTIKTFVSVLVLWI